MNGGLLDPESQLLIVSARVEDISVESVGNDMVVISVVNFKDGIEVAHSSDRLWRPV